MPNESKSFPDVAEFKRTIRLLAKAAEAKEESLTPTGAVLSLLCVLVTIPLRAWALMTLWGWFVVPLGAPAVTLWHMAGVSLLLSAMLWRYRKDADLTAEQAVEAVIASALYPPLVVGLAYIIHALAF